MQGLAVEAAHGGGRGREVRRQGCTPPKLRSPTTGICRCARCTRIWCVRPVSSVTASSVKPRRRSATRVWVTASRPRSTTAIRVRRLGWRPIGAAMRSPATTSPRTRASTRDAVHAGPAPPPMPRAHPACAPPQGAPSCPCRACAPGPRAANARVRARNWQRVDQGAVAVARARMHDETRRLVHDDNLAVRINHVERNRLGHVGDLRFEPCHKLDPLSAAQLVARAWALAVHGDLSASIHCFRRTREYSGSERASAASSLRPASSASATRHDDELPPSR